VGLTALPPIVQVVSLRLLLTVVPLGVALRRRADLALGRLPVDGAVSDVQVAPGSPRLTSAKALADDRQSSAANALAKAPFRKC
jgi:hypothetical protein